MTSGPDQIEADLAELVAEALDAVAEEFTARLSDADEIVAARFSVGSIAGMWSRRTGAIRDRLTRGVIEGAEALAEETGTSVDTDAAVSSWRARLDERLYAIGEGLASRARDVLTEAADAGRSIPQIKDRLRHVFRAGDSAQLGAGRAQQLAASEARGAWGYGQHAAAEAAEQAGVRIVKRWVSKQDDRVRSSHRHAHNQLREPGEPFTVGGHQMLYPGDPSAPPELRCNCRCELRYERIADTASLGGTPMSDSTSVLTFEGVTDGAEEALRKLAEAYGATVARSSAPGAAAEDEQAVQEPREKVRRWSTPGSTGLAFEGVQTGDGRIFAAGALSWDEDRSLPLQYADEMLQGHQGAELAGAIETMARDGQRITGEGVLYLSREAGADVAALLEANAPLGVSVDLDDVDVEFVVKPQEGAEEEDPVVASARIDAMSVTPLADGAWHVQMREHTPIVAAGGALVRTEQHIAVTTDTRGFVPAEALHAALDGAGVEMDYRLVAAAGDEDDMTGLRVVDQMHAGDALMRITRARVRGATAVAVPAFSDARIVLTDEPAIAERPAEVTAASAEMRNVVAYVSGAVAPVSTRQVAADNNLTIPQARGILSAAVRAGMLRRISPGRFQGVSSIPEGEMIASIVGDPDLPVATRAQWNADAAAKRVLAFAKGHNRAEERPEQEDKPRGQKDTGKDRGKGKLPPWLRGKVKNGRGGEQAAGVGSSNKLPWQKTKPTGDAAVDTAVLEQAFLWRDDSGDPTSLKAYKIGVADVIDGRLQLVPDGVIAAATLVHAGKLRIPKEDLGDLKTRVEALYGTLSEGMGRDLVPPWQEEGNEPDNTRQKGPRGRTGWGETTGGKSSGTGGKPVTASAAASPGPPAADAEDPTSDTDDVVEGPEDALVASAWRAVQDAGPMPAEWFKEPTAGELPDGAPGVNFAGGRVFGWVARKGEPHAGYPGKKLTIESLGRIDTSHFLRQRFALDDGSQVKAGVLTMNAGHHRDGAECETSSCLFDDTRTVAAIVTVGMNDRGMWFSGAAAPWMSSAWDLEVFKACQPSYHMVKRGASYQLRAVLAVPVPGHSTPLTAASVIERSNLAITAAAMEADTVDLPQEDDLAPATPTPAPVDSLEVLTQALTSEPVLNKLADALESRLAAARQEPPAPARRLDLEDELAELTAKVNARA